MSDYSQSGWRILRQSVKGASRAVIPLVSGLVILTSPATAIVDTNENGMSDLWEKKFNGGELLPETIDPQGDADGDGKLNKDEAFAGTDPFSGIPPEGFLQPNITHTPAVWDDLDGDEIPDLIIPETITVSWPTISGKQYTLLYSPDLSSGSWQPVEAPFVANGGISEFVFTLPGADKLFYRVGVNDIDEDGNGFSNYEELLDSDADGLSDWLEIENGFDPYNPDQNNNGIPDSQDDNDGDGVPNATEMGDGSNPNNGNDFAPQVIEITKAVSGSSNITPYEPPNDPYSGQYRLSSTWIDTGSSFQVVRDSAIDPGYLAPILESVAFPATPPAGFEASKLSLANIYSRSWVNYPPEARGMGTELQATRVWIKVPPSENEQRFLFIKAKDNNIHSHATNSNSSEFISAEIIEMVVPANQSLSQPIDLKQVPAPMPGCDLTSYTRLVPVEIQTCNSDGKWKTATELKVAKWKTAWNSDGYFHDDFIDGFGLFEPDRFRIRINVPLSLPEDCRTIHISTTGAGTAKYNDDSTAITLTKDPGLPDWGIQSDGFVSKPMILVADTFDNRFLNDNAQNDQTHIVALGSHVEFRLGGATMRLPVKKKGTVNVTSYILTPNGSVDSTLVEMALNDIEVAREIYTQVGLEIFSSVQCVPIPAGVNLSDGLLLDTLEARGVLSAEALAVLNSYATPGNQKDVVAIYVNSDIHTAGAGFGTVQGITFPRGWSNGGSFSGTFIISMKELDRATWSHELGHVLLNGQGGDLHNHYDDFNNLMRAGALYGDSHQMSSKRLSDSQETIMQQSTYLEKE